MAMPLVCMIWFRNKDMFFCLYLVLTMCLLWSLMQAIVHQFDDDDFHRYYLLALLQTWCYLFLVFVSNSVFYGNARFLIVFFALQLCSWMAGLRKAHADASGVASPTPRASVSHSVPLLSFLLCSVFSRPSTCGDRLTWVEFATHTHMNYPYKLHIAHWLVRPSMCLRLWKFEIFITLAHH